ncbi:MAG: hypothetical protein IE926_09825 [Micrococcales bacterium]|nr:hypothetical protein [Micrococcales bacterium]
MVLATMMAAGFAACSSAPEAPPPTTSPPSLPSPPVRSSAPSPTQPSPSASASSAGPLESASPLRVEAVDRFLAMRFDCRYVEDSFQDRWTTQAVKAGGYGEPQPGLRYAFDHVGGRAFTIFAPAFGGGIRSEDPIRVKSDAPGPGQVTVWVTKPKPDPNLELGAAVETSRRQLVAIMSTTRPAAEGSCRVMPAAPLPPISQEIPDDTT